MAAIPFGKLMKRTGTPSVSNAPPPPMGAPPPPTDMGLGAGAPTSGVPAGLGALMATKSKPAKPKPKKGGHRGSGGY